MGKQGDASKIRADGGTPCRYAPSSGEAAPLSKRIAPRRGPWPSLYASSRSSKMKMGENSRSSSGRIFVLALW